MHNTKNRNKVGLNSLTNGLSQLNKKYHCHGLIGAITHIKFHVKKNFLEKTDIQCVPLF
jgi:hypothetical protein